MRVAHNSIATDILSVALRFLKKLEFRSVCSCEGRKTAELVEKTLGARKRTKTKSPPYMYEVESRNWAWAGGERKEKENREKEGKEWKEKGGGDRVGGRTRWRMLLANNAGWRTPTLPKFTPHVQHAMTRLTSDHWYWHSNNNFSWKVFAVNCQNSQCFEYAWFCCPIGCCPI